MTMTTLRNVRLFPRTADAGTVDVEIEDGRFASFTPADSTQAIGRAGADTADADIDGAIDGADVIEGAGRALLPSLGDVHAHLDSNRMGQTFRPHTADGTLHGFIMNDRENWRQGERSVRD